MDITYLVTGSAPGFGWSPTLTARLNGLQQRGHGIQVVATTSLPGHLGLASGITVRLGQDPGAFSALIPSAEILVAVGFMGGAELPRIKAYVRVFETGDDPYLLGDPTFAGLHHEERRRKSDLAHRAPGVFVLADSKTTAGLALSRHGRVVDATLPIRVDRHRFAPRPTLLRSGPWKLLVVGPDQAGTRLEPLLSCGLRDVAGGLDLVLRSGVECGVVRVSSTPPELFKDPSVEFHLNPDRDAEARVYRAADILIHGSRYDSCPRAPLEAMSSGCAVVCTASDGALEYCVDGLNSLLVPAADSKAIAAAVQRLIKEPGLRERLVAGGYATAERLDDRQEIDELEGLLKGFLAAAKQGRGPAGFKVIKPGARSGAKVAAKPAARIELPPVARLGVLASAVAALDQGNPARAWDLGLEALKLRPFHPEALVLLARVALRGGDTAAAARLVQQAREWAPSVPLSGDLRARGQGVRAGQGAESSRWQVPLPGGRPRLSVCLIARNEERFLGRCLESVRGVADQIVVLDTGSTDRTLEIARAAGAEVYEAPWQDDFSLARNAALEKVRGDWVLVLDADEELQAGAAEMLLGHLQEPRVMAWRLPIVDVGREAEGASYVPRLFRNAPGLFFLGRIHEQIFSSVEVRRREWGLECRLATATLIHHGYTAEVTRDRRKIERNLRLLRQAVEELPDEPNLLMNLGLELVRSGRPSEGLMEYWAAFDAMSRLEPGDVVPELRETLLAQMTTHLLAAGRSEELVEVASSRLASCGGIPSSVLFGKGLGLMQSRQYPAAAAAFRECLAARERPSLVPVHADLRGAGPRHCLALCLVEMKQMEEAGKELVAAFAEDPKSRPVRFDLARLHAHHHRFVEALNLLTQLVSEKADDAASWELGSRIALARPEFIEFALDWTGEAVRALPEHPGLVGHRVDCLMLSGRAGEVPALVSRMKGPLAPSLQGQVVLCALVSGAPDLNPGASDAVAGGAEQAFLAGYRRLIEFGRREAVSAVHSRLDRVRARFPGAVAVIGTAAAAGMPQP